MYFIAKETMTSTILLLVLALSIYTSTAYAFTSSIRSIALSRRKCQNFRITPQVHQSVTETADDIDADTDTPIIPANLPSKLGIDYVPLATMLATRDFLGADQFTRDNLIRIAGPAAVSRGFVYFTDVKKLSLQDLVTMEKLWLQFSDGKFGYSVQQRAWDMDRGNFENFIRRIGWTVMDDELERKRKWFGANEFIYDLEKAPKGHLPLTSALRGTQLIRYLMEMPLWKQYDWKNYENIPWEIKE